MTRTESAERYLDGLESDYLREMQQCYIDFTKAEDAIVKKYSRFKVGDRISYTTSAGEEKTDVVVDIYHDLMKRKCEMIYVFDLDDRKSCYESNVLGLA